MKNLKHVSKTVEGVASVTEDELDMFEFSLAKEAAISAKKGVYRGELGTVDETNQVRQEIIGILRRGVRVATHAESLPLLPLLEAAGADLPPTLQVAQQDGYVFYVVEVTFSILLDEDEYPSRAEFAITINDDTTKDSRKSRPIQLFPKHKDRDLFRFDLEGGIGINAKMEFAVPMANEIMVPFTEINADAKLRAKFLVGPFEFRFRKAEIEVIGESSHEVGWRYNIHTPLRGANSFKSFLLLKVDREASRVELDTNLGVVPCRPTWVIFEKKLPVLRDSAKLAVEL
jgi:hypothetical protein